MMNRGYSREDYVRKIEVIRRARREITITGDVIVGFPGETEADFKQTLKLINEVQFDGLYIFKYSPRPGTPAVRWGDHVPEKVKTERLMEADALQREVQIKKHASYIWKIYDVLVEGTSHKSKFHLTGHTTCHQVVNFEGAVCNMDGATVKVEVLRVNPHSLYGRLVSGAC
jgi:tRNA-2-methylthio-N6-dimethylallyladenosine synthase